VERVSNYHLIPGGICYVWRGKWQRRGHDLVGKNGKTGKNGKNGKNGKVSMTTYDHIWLPWHISTFLRGQRVAGRINVLISGLISAAFDRVYMGVDATEAARKFRWFQYWNHMKSLHVPDLCFDMFWSSWQFGGAQRFPRPQSCVLAYPMLFMPCN
jgi:hypothetical protein